MGNKDKFDAIAQQYDTPERAEVAALIADAIKLNMPDKKVAAAIDYGCGTGLVGLNLLDSVDTMLFIDASENMIDVVREKLRADGIEHASTLCCDFMTEAPQDLRTDAVFLVQTLLHERNWRRLLTCLYDVLLPGGYLYIVDFDKNEKVSSETVHNGFEQTVLAENLRMIGCCDVFSETFYHGKKMFMNQDASLFIMRASRPDKL